MLNPKLLLTIIGVVTLLGVSLMAYQLATGGGAVGWTFGGLLTAVGLGFLYLWWRMNQLLEISQALMANNIDLARQKLAAVKNPEKLNPYSKTYFYFFQGMVEVQSNNLKGARNGFKTALETNRFRSVDERATALLMMAQLDLRSHNNEGAKRYLREAKALEPGEQVREQISMIVKQARLRL